MLTSLTFTKFRSFESLQVEQLTRVNVFVGQNNAGKSSILEGVELLMSGGTLAGACRIAWRRNETLVVGGEQQERRHVDIQQLFWRRELWAGNRFEIESDAQAAAWCKFNIVQAAFAGNDLREFHDDPLDGVSVLALQCSSSLYPNQPITRLSSTNGIASSEWALSSALSERSAPLQFVGTESMDLTRLGILWDSVVLTPNEVRVLAALRIIEPHVAGIAFIGRNSLARAVVKFDNIDERLPLGSMGDGIKRLLSLALSATHAAGGILLIDEVDTGLHHSVMAKMWRMLIETARTLDIQIFCTTHSNDCIRMLAEVCGKDDLLRSEVSVHRVESGKSAKTTPYSGEELQLAVQHDMEIR